MDLIVNHINNMIRFFNLLFALCKVCSFIGAFMIVDQKFECIKFAQIDNIGILTINRPEKLNALNVEVLQELQVFFDLLIADQMKNIKTLILTGEGEKAFIAGADIKAMSKMNRDEAYSMARLGQQVTLSMESLSVPIIAAVNGFALGGGCEMAMACDFIVATESAVFGQPEVKLGLIPGFGGTQRLSKIIGRNKAKELIFTGRNMTSKEALENGLVIKLCSDKKQLLETCMKIAETISRNAPKAISNCKQIMNDGNDLLIKDGLEIEAEVFSKVFETEEMIEGTSAFLEKRRAKF